MLETGYLTWILWILIFVYVAAIFIYFYRKTEHENNGEGELPSNTLECEICKKTMRISTLKLGRKQVILQLKDNLHEGKREFSQKIFKRLLHHHLSKETFENACKIFIDTKINIKILFVRTIGFHLLLLYLISFLNFAQYLFIFLIFLLLILFYLFMNLNSKNTKFRQIYTYKYGLSSFFLGLTIPICLAFWAIYHPLTFVYFLILFVGIVFLSLGWTELFITRAVKQKKFLLLL